MFIKVKSDPQRHWGIVIIVYKYLIKDIYIILEKLRDLKKIFLIEVYFIYSVVLGSGI